MSYGLLTPEQAEILRKRFLLQEATGNDLKDIAKNVGVGCMHDACPNCGGTGIRKDGLVCVFTASPAPARSVLSHVDRR